MCRYCTRLESPSFWGGEVEILILSKMLRTPIHVMQRAQEVGRCESFVKSSSGNLRCSAMCQVWYI